MQSTHSVDYKEYILTHNCLDYREVEWGQECQGNVCGFSWPCLQILSGTEVIVQTATIVSLKYQVRVIALPGNSGTINADAV